MTIFRPTTGAMNQLPDEVVAQANDAYWNSDEGVNRLAKEFDLSKGALYDIIAALPAGLPCPQGDGELVYTNRTARERGFVSCATCGFADEASLVRSRLEEADAVPMPATPAPATPAPATPAPATPRPATPPPATPGTGRKLEALLVVTVLAGLAAGLFLSGVLRRRGDT